MNPTRKNLETSSAIGIGLTGLIAGFGASIGADAWDKTKEIGGKLYDSATKEKDSSKKSA